MNDTLADGTPFAIRSRLTDMHMNTWSRCRRCGAVNDHDANLCYLCGASSLMRSCPHCGTDFTNPMDTRCPSCRRPYQNSSPPDRQAPIEWNEKKENDNRNALEAR